MTESEHIDDAREIQKAADILVSCNASDRTASFLAFSYAVLEHFSYPSQSGDYLGLFSPDLPHNVQRFIAAWLLRILSRSPRALEFDDVERLAASLFDRVIPKEIYSRAGLDAKSQTYEKLQSLTDFMQQTVTTSNPKLVMYVIYRAFLDYSRNCCAHSTTVGRGHS